MADQAGKSKGRSVASMKYEKLFCSKCGTLLDLPESRDIAKCALCGFRRQVKSLQALELTGQIGPEDFLRRYGVDPLVPLAAELVGADEEKANKRQRATVDEECPKCGNPEMEYYTLQLRSADEGQTVFYECPKCKFKFSHNN